MQKTRFSAISPANSLQFYIIPAAPRALGQLYRQNPQWPFLAVLWWGLGVQYKPQDPSHQIQNASKIQTLFIIQDKKKAPMKGPKFILEGCYLGCGIDEISFNYHVVERVAIRLHKASEAGARPILIFRRNVYNGKSALIFGWFKHLTSNVDICDVMDR